MPPFYTLTGNLLAERTLEFPGGWSPGRTQRAARESFQVGGKGFNVAKMLQRLGADVTALGFAGGASGEECRAWLAAHARYRHQLFTTDSPTRTGFVVRSPQQPETTWLAPDRPVGAAALAACAEFLNTLPDDAIVALCGSFPGWGDPSAAGVRAALERRARRGTLVVDAYGPPLQDLVRTPAALVKINATEFASLLGGETADGSDCGGALEAALQKWPVRAWVVTDGPGPVWTASAEGVRVWQPPPVTEVSPTGSGDVLLGALLHACWERRRPLVEALPWALALAAANAASAGIADFPLPG